MMRLENVPLFMGFEDAARQLEAAGHVRMLSKGDFLFHRGDPFEAIYWIRQGWVKLLRETKAGDEAVLDVLSGGALIGEGVDEDVYPYSAEAVDSVELLRIARKDFQAVLVGTAGLQQRVIQQLSMQHLALRREMEHLVVQNAPQRIGCFLLGFVRGQASGEANFVLPFEKSLIAARLGMKPETFSRALNQLKGVGVEVVQREVRIADVEILADYTCQACSDSFPCD